MIRRGNYQSNRNFEYAWGMDVETPNGIAVGEPVRPNPAQPGVPLNPQHLATFIAVVDADGRFSMAASQIGMSQPGISHQMNELERRIGVQLFDRARGRPARLTRAGRVFEQYARSIAELHGALQGELDDMRKHLRGHLRVGASPGPGEHWLPPHLCAFGAKHPHLQIELHVADSRTIVEAVAANELELGFVGGRWSRSGLRFEPVYEDELVLICAPDHTLQTRQGLTLDELAGADLVVAEPGSGLRVTLDQELSRRGQSLRYFRVLAELGSQESVKSAVAAGYGMGWVWRGSVAAELAVGSLKCLDVTDFHLDNSFYAVRRERRLLSRGTQAFMSFLDAARH